MNDMDTVREYVNQGLSLRAKAGLKVRQPLASVSVPALWKHFYCEPILRDELNVKEVKVSAEVAIDEKLTPELKREGLMREVIRHVQSARKAAGLNVDDRIALSLSSEDDELVNAINEHEQTIMDETLATQMVEHDLSFAQSVKVEGSDLVISLEKV